MGMTLTDAIVVTRMSLDSAERFTRAPSEAGRVHSVFDRAVNLAWHDGQLLTLQESAPLVAPFAVALDRLPRSPDVYTGAPVRRRGGALALAEFTLDWKSAAVANTAMPAGRCGADLLLLDRLSAIAECAPALNSAAARLARARLAEGLRTSEADAFVDGALGLLGLGEGLTPAGDDFLVGTLAVVHRCAPSWLRERSAIAATIGGRADGATTAVAREFVSHALAGHFAESLIELLTAESSEAAERAAARLLSTGATSGADTLAGVRAAIRAWTP
jgi:hypothetical protein